MSRLTEKCKPYRSGENVIEYSLVRSYAKCVDKLGKLEDLEEEIGVKNLIAFLEWCIKFRDNFINRTFDDMVAFYKKAMCVTEGDKSE